MGSFPLYYYFSSIISGFRFRLVLSTSLTKSSKSVAKISHKKFMIYISHKQQAKIISTNSSSSSTDLTNILKKLLGNRVSLLSHYFQLLKKLLGNQTGFHSNYFWPLKIITQWTGGSSTKPLFFYYKKQQATGSSAASSQLNA
tara:strand:- start:170 stop:598 length:429 start_codon:yes stop_codon:yes gene_type:complete